MHTAEYEVIFLRPEEQTKYKRSLNSARDFLISTNTDEECNDLFRWDDSQKMKKKWDDEK